MNRLLSFCAITTLVIMLITIVYAFSDILAITGIIDEPLPKDERPADIETP